MGIQTVHKQQYWLVAIVAAFVGATLTWEHLNGGVISHYLLHNPNYPSISNYWGMLVLPTLAWVAAHRVIKRMKLEDEENKNVAVAIPKHVKMGFAIMFCVTALQSIAWVLGHQDITMYLALGMLVAGLFVPIYRSECILAHVLASSVIFGAVIPLLGMLIMASISAVSNLVIKPVIVKLSTRLRTVKAIQ
ncbi:MULTISPECIES: hypothetical protein [Pseudoalteromonas]|uniref:Uncharacterized protein n=1 Tax=Pseudoalteromonas amylolytica TaxID=1859457 RepID=A0A1S1MZ09_9GAMM|nr:MULTISPECIES: hypothetical protein [Pseudoalteromonas]OHU85395.1 hypothetical protein BFC16_18765 [Pseudoalteromonas sp. JW3]OHU92984.1 hypothetical protein BET10_02950 [Pseudoalteromonas amylolytica]